MFRRYALTIVIGMVMVWIPCTKVFSQQDSLRGLLKKFDQYKVQTLQEKLFVHTDRSFYLTGETMWFKVYAVDATLHKPLDLNKVAYLEILDPENNAVLQTKITMSEGGGNGTFFLPTSLNSGYYVLRAYTQWMRNFSADFYFQQRITIVNPFAALGLKPADPKVQYDVQFFPEGGHLVTDLASTVGFRVVNKNGNGIEFSGAVIDERNDTVAHFHPLKFGIGNFNFTARSGHRYKAIIRDNNGSVSIHPMSVAETEGYVMHVRDSGASQLAITVRSRFADGSSRKPFIYFLAHTRQVLAQAQVQFQDHGKAIFLVDKNILGEGISHLTIFNDDMVPVCERLYFKQPTSKLVIDVEPDQRFYGPRKKVNVELLAHTTEEARLSVAVYKMDSLPSSPPDVVSYFWLTSELKGAIESPEYYFNAGRSDRQAMDNLMLTHGWSRFRWVDILTPRSDPFEFIPENNGHVIHALLTDTRTQTPGKRINTYLSTPGKNIRLYVSRSDDEGKAQFEMKDFTGTRRVIVQTNYRIDSTFRIELVSPFSSVFSAFRPAQFDLSEKFKTAITSRSFNMQIQNAFYDENPNHIMVPKIDSSAFYGKASEVYLLDDYTRFPTMEEVMREYVPGVLVRIRKGKFHFMTIDKPNKSVFRTDPMVLIDGMPVFEVDKIMQFDPRKIRKLDVITQKYFLGPLSFDGLVSYTTYKGDLGDFQPDPRALVARYDGLQWSREFFTPRYESAVQKASRIPDFRNLLYWNPNIRTHGKQHLDFFSSDVPGTYIIVVQGLAADGKPGATYYTFTVVDHELN